MNYTHSIPRTIPETITLAGFCRAAAEAYEAEVGLKHNRADAIAADYYDIVGEPDTAPGTAGKEAVLNQARHLEFKASEQRREAVEAGRKFNERAIDSLKAHLGRRWNPLWVGAGFTRGSLALPRDPLPLLLELREYLRHRPEHEIASIRLTAEEADLLSAAILQAVYLESKAGAARAVARRARDAAFIKLRARLVGLRAELLQLLTPDDSAWRKFGFARPSDRRSPKPVAEVSVRAGVEAGEVIVEWPPAVGAENYRVMRRVEDIDPEPVEVGIFTDRLVIFRALPAAKSVIISVSARNQAGEARAATARLIRADAGSSNPSGPG